MREKERKKNRMKYVKCVLNIITTILSLWIIIAANLLCTKHTHTHTPRKKETNTRNNNRPKANCKQEKKTKQIRRDRTEKKWAKRIKNIKQKPISIHIKKEIFRFLHKIKIDKLYMGKMKKKNMKQKIIVSKSKFKQQQKHNTKRKKIETCSF